MYSTWDSFSLWSVSIFIGRYLRWLKIQVFRRRGEENMHFSRIEFTLVHVYTTDYSFSGAAAPTLPPLLAGGGCLCLSVISILFWFQAFQRLEPYLAVIEGWVMCPSPLYLPILAAWSFWAIPQSVTSDHPRAIAGPSQWGWPRANRQPLMMFILVEPPPPLSLPHSYFSWRNS